MVVRCSSKRGGRGIGDEGYGRRGNSRWEEVLPDERRASGDVQEEERAFTTGGSHNTIVNVIVMMMMVRVGMGVTTL